jgi:Periplasmic serine proteases (ClpP class)
MAEQNDRTTLGTAEWGRGFVEELARETLKEKRAKRRWRIFLWLVFFALVGFSVQRCTQVGAGQQGGEDVMPANFVASISIEGALASGTANEEVVSAERVNRALRRAFDDKRVVGVILRINSPGGSSVQAGAIVDEIRRLRRKHPDKPVHAVIDEVGASAAYYVASAADNIYVNKASVVGSIGVILGRNGVYGVEEAMKKLGIERRTLTAGKNKALFDPTAPFTPEQKAHVQSMLDELHRQFITVVKEGRGQRLKESPDMFSGLVWTGERSIALGLADGLGSVDSVARDVLNTEAVIDYSDYSPLQKFFRQIGAEAMGGAWQQLESRFAAQQTLRVE